MSRGLTDKNNPVVKKPDFHKIGDTQWEYSITLAAL
jgi:hypothetical protein